MKYIVYVSQAKAPFSKDELVELLRRSRARNTDDGITGLLLYRFSEDLKKGYFMQCIEGPDARLDALWDRISQDSRHHTIVTLGEGAPQDRMFPDWSMGFKNVDAQDLARFPGLVDFGTDSFWQRISSGGMPEALDLLHSFYESS